MTLTRRQIVACVAAAAAVAAVYFAVDPMQAPWMPKCMLHVVTGFDCPGCGSQRALHALLHGDLPGAFRANALLLAMIPYILLILYAELFRERVPRLFRAVYSQAAIIAVVAVVMAWGVVRNFI